MAVGITVVSLQRPDLEVCDRLARLVLASIDPPIDRTCVTAAEVSHEFHEFGDRHVVWLEAQTREAATYVAMLVLSTVIAALYLGEVVDDAAFFPSVDALELLQTCLANEVRSADELWQRLRNVGI